MKVIQKLYDQLTENKYVKYNDFRCQDIIEMDGRLDGIAHYRFNTAEKLGHALLKQKSWALLGSIGFGVLLRKIGALFNAKAKLRDQALGYYKQIVETKLPHYIERNKNVLINSLEAGNRYHEMVERFEKTHDMESFHELDRNYARAIKEKTDASELEAKVRAFFADEPPIADAYFEAIAKKALADELAAKLMNPLQSLEAQIPEIKLYKNVLDQLDQPKN
jgi:hypothetical protein